jgi:hypothetical protein
MHDNASAIPTGPFDDSHDRERVGTLVPILLVVIAILILFLTRGCGIFPTSYEDGARSIEAAPELEAVPGVVSVWVSPNTTIERTMQAAGVDGKAPVDLGDGRYVIEVPEGTERGAAAALAGTTGVYDAGLVFKDEGLVIPDQP